MSCDINNAIQLEYKLLHYSINYEKDIYIAYYYCTGQLITFGFNDRQLLDEVFVISRIIKVKYYQLSRRCDSMIPLTKTLASLIIQDITCKNQIQCSITLSTNNDSMLAQPTHNSVTC